MNFRTASFLAFGAALAGGALFLYRMIAMLIALANLGVPGTSLALIFLSGNNWIFWGLAIFLAVLLFRPGAIRAGALTLVGFAVLESGLAVYKVVSLFFSTGYAEMLGDQRFIFYQGAVWALSVLTFAIFFALRPMGKGATIPALLASLAAMAGVFLTVKAYSLQGMLADILVLTIISLWFWLLFLNGGRAEVQK